MNDDLANADREALLAATHEEYTGFATFPDYRGSHTYQDIGPDAFTEPEVIRWDDYEVLVSVDLAVIKGNRTNEHPVLGSVKQFRTEVYKKEDGQWKLIHQHTSYAGE